jgi:hypothetical protein
MTPRLQRKVRHSINTGFIQPLGLTRTRCMLLEAPTHRLDTSYLATYAMSSASESWTSCQHALHALLPAARASRPSMTTSASASPIEQQYHHPHTCYPSCPCRTVSATSTNSPTSRKRLLDLALLTSDAGMAAVPGISGTTTTTASSFPSTSFPSSSTSNASNNGAQNGNGTTKTLMAGMEELDFDDLFV